MEKLKISTNEMQLADVVSPCYSSMPFGTSTVKQIRNGEVTLFRPYVHTADFSCTSGVICCIGIEEYKVPLHDIKEYFLLERRSLK